MRLTKDFSQRSLVKGEAMTSAACMLCIICQTETWHSESRAHEVFFPPEYK